MGERNVETIQYAGGSSICSNHRLRLLPRLNARSQAPDLGKNLPMLSQSNAAGQTLTEIFGPYFSVFVDAQDKWVHIVSGGIPT
jgi:hypothetical protein